VVIGFLVGLLIFGKPWGLPPAWGDIPTWITAIATMLLAAFAVITAYYARQAFRTQSEQLADQKRVNTKQIDALNLQVRELRASLTERKRAQASKVDIRIGVGPDPRFGVFPCAASIPAPETVTARVTNGSDQPIYNAELIWDDSTLSYIEFTVWPGADDLALRIGPRQTASMTKRPTDTPRPAAQYSASATPQATPGYAHQTATSWASAGDPPAAGPAPTWTTPTRNPCSSGRDRDAAPCVRGQGRQQEQRVGPRRVSSAAAQPDHPNSHTSKSAHRSLPPCRATCPPPSPPSPPRYSTASRPFAAAAAASANAGSSGPGAHEINAQNAITGSRVDEAQVHAILALASAVNRLAAAAEAIAAAQT